MEKSRAIELLKLAVPIKALTQQEYSDFVEAVNMGMDALEQPEERTEKRMETHACDLISRSEAIDAIDKQIKQCCKALGSLCLSDVDKHAVEVEMVSLRAYRGMLENLPTAQPEPQEGHWIEGKIYRDVIECYCSECGQIMTTAATVRMNYCPNCGADMRGEKDG